MNDKVGDVLAYIAVAVILGAMLLNVSLAADRPTRESWLLKLARKVRSLKRR